MILLVGLIFKSALPLTELLFSAKVEGKISCGKSASLILIILELISFSKALATDNKISFFNCPILF